MALTKVEYVDGETVIAGQNLNDIQDSIIALEGKSTENGATFTPSVSESGVISWTNDKGLENPTPVNIKGPAYTLTAADKAEIVEAVLGEMTNAETEAL